MARDRRGSRHPGWLAPQRRSLAGLSLDNPLLGWREQEFAFEWLGATKVDWPAPRSRWAPRSPPRPDSARPYRSRRCAFSRRWLRLQFLMPDMYARTLRTDLKLFATRWHAIRKIQARVARGRQSLCSIASSRQSLESESCRSDDWIVVSDSVIEWESDASESW